MEVEDDSDATSGPGADNVIPFERAQSFRVAHAGEISSRDDDELLKNATDTIANWQTASNIPSLTQVQELFYESICAGASPMTRDRVVAAIVAAFGENLGGKRALGSTWNRIAKDFAAECAQAAREKRGGTKPAALTPAEKPSCRKRYGPR